tara:strand:- start:12 stop:974 length:963 start_codon:yes stop_codon:yes gene_type:complete
MSELQEFFNLIAQAKKEPLVSEKKEEQVVVTKSELSDFFSELTQAKKEQDKKFEKEKAKLEELETLLSQTKKPKRKKVVVTKVKTVTKPKIVLQEPEPVKVKKEVKEEVLLPVKEKSSVDVVVDELNKQQIKEVTGLDVHEKEIKNFKDLLKEFLRFKKLTIQQLSSLGGGGGSGSEDIDLSEVAQDIIPDGNGTRNLGSDTKRWKKIFLASQTVDLGGAEISSDGTGTIEIAATGATLPSGSKAGANELAVVSTGSSGAAGQVSRVVPFFSAADGLSTKNTDFEFNAVIDEKFVFTGTKTFTLANGSALADSDPTLFQF